MGLLNFGVWSFIVPSVSYNLLSSVSLYLKRPHSLDFCVKKKELKEVTYFGLSYTLVRVTHYAGFQIDKVLFGRLASLDDLAIYEKAQTLSYLPGKILGNAFDPVLFSVLTGARDKQEQVSKILIGLSNGLLIVMIYVSTILFFCAESVVRLVLGEAWLDSAELVTIFALIVPFMVLSRIADVFVRSYNKMFHVLPVKVAYAVAVGLIALTSNQMTTAEFTSAVAATFVVFAIVMTGIAVKISGVGVGTYLAGLKTPFIVLPVLAAKVLLMDFLYRQTGFPLLYEALTIVAIDFVCVAIVLISNPNLMSRIKESAFLQPIFAKLTFLRRTSKR